MRTCGRAFVRASIISCSQSSYCLLVIHFYLALHCLQTCLDHKDCVDDTKVNPNGMLKFGKRLSLYKVSRPSQAHLPLKNHFVRRTLYGFFEHNEALIQSGFVKSEGLIN